MNGSIHFSVSCISPILFLIFQNDIDVDLNPDIIASLFADEKATWMMDKILWWANKLKMTANKVLRSLVDVSLRHKAG